MYVLRIKKTSETILHLYQNNSRVKRFSKVFWQNVANQILTRKRKKSPRPNPIELTFFTGSENIYSMLVDSARLGTNFFQICKHIVCTV